LKKNLVNIIRIGAIIILILNSCKSKSAYYENKKIITNACELKNSINDTIVIKGVYYQCMEYTGFKAFSIDSCQEDFDMDLNFYKIELSKDLLKIIYKIEGCTGTIKMTLKGVLKNDSKIGYGHLGSNNAELILLKVIDFGKVKYIKP